VGRGRWIIVAAGAVVVVVIASVIVWWARSDDPSGGTAQPGTGRAAQYQPRVVGYFGQWGVYAHDYQVRNVETSGAADRLTHLLYAFGAVRGGRCAVGDPAADLTRVVAAGDSVDGVADTPAQPLRGSLNQLLKLKQRHPTLKVLWSFGGWNGSAGFAEAARDPATFAASCRTLLDDPRWKGLFDGIDVDWEYPNACGPTCDTSGRDGLTRIAAALRTEFGPDRPIAAAITADAIPGGRIDRADYATAATHLDWVMPMTYDYFGTDAGPGRTAAHSALTSYPGIPRADATADAAITKLLGLGIPSRKLLLGISFYGRGWTGVTQTAPGGSAKGLHGSGIEAYNVLKTSCPPTGTIGGTAYAHCGTQWWSYDTPDTITTKMAYATGRSLGGAFAWELSNDTPDGELLAALTAAL
jgi:chitinase